MSQNVNLTDLRITIVGLGLMGGSMARALHRHGCELVAVDLDRQTLDDAVAEGVISYGTNDLRIGVSKADAVILATPVRYILDILDEMPRHRPDGCFVMDLGSTKGAIGEAMSALPDNFEAIGGHPHVRPGAIGIPSCSLDFI